MHLFIAFFLAFAIITLTATSQLQRIKSSLKETIAALERLEDDEPSKKQSSLGRPSSCAELLLEGNTKSGIYTIYPRPWFRRVPFEVYCDMDTDGGGWTLFQKRDDFETHENFFRGWDDYRRGFGKLEKEFWLGNDHLYLLTNQDHVTLRVDLEDFEGNKRHAVYKTFQVASWVDSYKVQIDKHSGDVGNNLDFNGVPFVTFDRNDNKNCSSVFKGGWWYQACHRANLNGLYLKGNHSSFADGIEWHAWKGYHYSLKRTEMKVRPTSFLNCDEE